MSLVINSNQSMSRVSNDMYGSYPDFNQILLRPSGYSLRGNSSYTFPTAFSVNGTVVNMVATNFSENLADSNDLVSNGMEIVCVGATGGTNFQFVIGSDFVLNGGEIIGKENIIGVCCTTSPYTNTNTVDYKVEIGLLHSDGTITWGSAFGRINKTYTAPFKYVEKQKRTTTGISALAGDHVIARVNVKLQSSSTSDGGGLHFGQTTHSDMFLTYGTSTAGNRPGVHLCGPLPIQISIE